MFGLKFRFGRRIISKMRQDAIDAVRLETAFEDMRKSRTWVWVGITVDGFPVKTLRISTGGYIEDDYSGILHDYREDYYKKLRRDYARRNNNMDSRYY